MNIETWEEMIALIKRLVALGATTIVQNVSADAASASVHFGHAARVGLAVDPLDGDSRGGVSIGEWYHRFDSALEAIEFVEACHAAAAGMAA